jgi:hypothetical protein
MDLMNTAFFDNPKFRNLCIENRIEPMINGEDRLVLLCPKLPDDNIKDQFKALIPSDMSWDFAEGLSHTIISAVKVLLVMFGVPAAAFGFGPAGSGAVELMIPEAPKATATQPGSPLWDQVANLLQRDPFTKVYRIVVGGEVYRDSTTGYVKPDDFDGVSEDMPQPAHQESQLLTAAKKGVKPPTITDDRFDYDKDFLPKDVGTDVRIMLESCNSVEDFLKNI